MADQSQSQSFSEPASKPKTRGPTTCKALMKKRKNDEPISLEYDEHGVPIGESGKLFKAYVGSVVRNRVDINIKNWNEVDNRLKDTIWNDIKKTFNIPNDDKKNVALKVAGIRWKYFKARLVREYIKKKNPKYESPPECYEYLTHEQWETFLANHSTDEFKERSQKAREKQMLNQNPHYLGSAGYSGKKAEWTLSDPLSSQSLSTSSILELAGKDGKYYIPNNKTTETLEKIVEKCEEIRQGSFQSNMQNDILAAVLDNKKGDRGGYVRGVGVYTNVRDVFGKPDKPRERSGGLVSVDDLRDLIKKDMYSDIKNEVYLEIKNEVFLNLKEMIKNEIGSDIRKEVYSEGSPQTVQMHFEPPRHTRSSVHSVYLVQFDLIEDPIQCRLAVLINGESTKVVGRGMIYRSTTDTLVHNEPLLPNHVKVMVDEIVDAADEFRIHVPIQHRTRVGEIVGSFAQWPIHLVGIGEEDIIINKTGNASSHEQGDLSTTGLRPPLVDDDHLERLGDNAKKLHTLLRRVPPRTEYLEVVLDPDIFHHTNMSYIFVSLEGIKDLFSMGWIDVSIIQIFIRYLHKLCMSIENNSIGFMCPSRISKASIAQNVDAVTTYLFDTMCTLETKTLILAPYHQENHWLLLVILANAIPRSVYVLDPINCDRDLAIKPTLNTSFRMLSDHQSLRAKLPYWINVTCPQQPGGV